MTRISKQGERRQKSPRRPRRPSCLSSKTGPKAETQFRSHENAVLTSLEPARFIGKRA